MSAKKSLAYLERIRNIGIIAHIDAGKTTLTERILFYSDKIHRLGEVHDGTATMDFMPEEQERGITISSACTTCEWNNHSISLIDTPGHVDFTIEVERALRVLDGAVGVFCAVGGVEPQSETVWRQSEKFEVPKLAFINKIDRPGADFFAALEAMRARLGAVPLPLTVPLPADESPESIIDLITLEEVHFEQADQGRCLSRRALAAEHLSWAEEQRERMLETLAECDEEFFTIFLSGQAVAANIRPAIRRATLARALVPVYAGSALRNIGVQLLMDGICDYLPGPLDIAPPRCVNPADGREIELVPDPDGPLAALVFKVVMEGSRKYSFLRIYSGSVKEGDTCRNPTARAAKPIPAQQATGDDATPVQTAGAACHAVSSAARGMEERFSKIYRMHAGRRDSLDVARAGELVAAVGLRSVRTGDTLSSADFPYVLENISTYRPVISLALEPKNAEEGTRLDEVLERLLLEDPTLNAEQDEATGQRIVSGMGELHLEVVLERIAREYGIRPRVGNPQVVHQESVVAEGEGTGEFDRELGDQHHYGYVSVRVSPAKRGSGVVVQWADDCAATVANWPKPLLDAIDQGVSASLQSGVKSGFPVDDVVLTILDARRRDGVSTPAGYHMAAMAAVKQALGNASPVLLEPIMSVEISVVESFVGAAISLLGARGGKVENMTENAGQKLVQAYAPLRNLFGFSTALRSATQGRAGLLMRFERFDRMS